MSILKFAIQFIWKYAFGIIATLWMIAGLFTNVSAFEWLVVFGLLSIFWEVAP